MAAYSFGRPKGPKLPVIEIRKLRLADYIGSGGLGSIYGGHFGGKEAAVKVYRPQQGLLADADKDREALVAEARKLQHFAHPHIVDVFCVVTDRGNPSGFAMERLGDSLQTASSRGQGARSNGNHFWVVTESNRNYAGTLVWGSGFWSPTATE